MAPKVVKDGPAASRGHELIEEKEGMPVSDLVRGCLKKYVLLYRFRKLREMVLPFAKAQGILTDEDVSKLIS
jgi:hypothetical protein